jgi:phenylacetate-coenzyme A ligase PaaK-like adenylate-forming protein
MSYWNPYLETLPRETLRTIEPKNFREILRHAKKSSPFIHYRLMVSRGW